MGANRVASRRTEKWDCLNPIQVRYLAALRPDATICQAFGVEPDWQTRFNYDA